MLELGGIQEEGSGKSVCVCTAAPLSMRAILCSSWSRPTSCIAWRSSRKDSKIRHSVVRLLRWLPDLLGPHVGLHRAFSPARPSSGTRLVGRLPPLRVLFLPPALPLHLTLRSWTWNGTTYLGEPPFDLLDVEPAVFAFPAAPPPFMATRVFSPSQMADFVMYSCGRRPSSLAQVLDTSSQEALYWLEVAARVQKTTATQIREVVSDQLHIDPSEFSAFNCGVEAIDFFAHRSLNDDPNN